MIDFMRVNACPRCRRGFPDAPPEIEADAIDCPVCKGRPVRVLVLWNSTVEDADYFKRAANRVHSRLALKHQLMGEAAVVAADVLERPPGACGPVFGK